MISVLWILCSLPLFIRGEHLSWPRSLSKPECPLCKQYIRPGSNFSSILMTDSKLVIGAKNAVFSLDFEEESAHFFPDKIIPPASFETCTNEYGQNKEDCQNYYKVILKLRNQDLFICGTEAFKPSCSVRSLDDLSYSTYNQDLSGICPASPHSPTTYIKLSDMQNVGFAASAIGVVGEEHAIQRIDLKYGSFGAISRTKSDDFWLKSPDFVYMFEDGDFVYILFKEIAAEEHPERIFSRVARICKTDEGSQNAFFKGNFLTFVKARLQCSYNRDGSSPYLFNSISSAYYLDKTLYVLFTSSNNIVDTGSVLCTFSIEDVQRAFTSSYKNFQNGYWQSKENPEPFTCTDTRAAHDVQDQGLLMTQSIVANPRVLLHSHLDLKATVASQIEMAGEDLITIYAGSSDGKVLRLGISTDNFEEVRTTKVRTFDTSTGGIDSLVNDDNSPGAVYALSQDAITYIPLDSECSIYSSCQTCQDAYPGCGWCYDPDREIGKCDKTSSCNRATKHFYGPFSSCPALPDFAEKPQDLEIDLGKTAVFNCSATNEMATRRRWEKVQGHLPYDITPSDDGTLRITSASSSDMGCYQCVLRGVSGTVSSVACLSVRIALHFTLLPTDNTVSVSAGEDVRITCRAAGYPPPEFQWAKLEGELPEGHVQSAEGDLKLIRVINQDEGVYRCTASNRVSRLSQDIIVKVIGSDPEQGKMNGGENYDVTIIAAAVGVVLIVILFLAIGVKVFINRTNNKKGGSQYSSVPEGAENAALRYPTSLSRCGPGVPGSSLPTHLHSDMYSHPIPFQPNTIAISSRQQNGGSPGFPASLLEYNEQPPPPYHPHLLARLPEQDQHEYDEINIMLQQQQHHHHRPDILTANGYNATFHSATQGLMGPVSPPIVGATPLIIPPTMSGGGRTPPQIPERSSYDVMRRDSPPHRLQSGSPMHSPPQSQMPSPWGQNSDI